MLLENKVNTQRFFAKDCFHQAKFDELSLSILKRKWFAIESNSHDPTISSVSGQGPLIKKTIFLPLDIVYAAKKQRAVIVCRASSSATR